MREIFTTESQREDYRPGYLFQYPKSITFVSYFIFLISGSIFYVIFTLKNQRTPFLGITLEELTVITILVYALAEFLRMLIQRGINRLLGYHIAFDLSQILTSPQTYIGEPGQYQQRRNVIFIAGAPFVLFILLWVPLLLGLQGIYSEIIAYFLFVNASRSLGDLYIIWRMIRMPKQTLIYTLDAKRRLVFERNV